MKILLSAFEPFGGQTINASQQIAREVRLLRFEGALVETVELPVVRCQAPQLLLDALSRFRPDVLLMLGEAGGRAAISPERVAINVDDFPIPDNAGNCPREEPVAQGAPAAYFSTLPFVAIQQELRAQNVPCEVSNSAGTFVCNHLFYYLMHHLTQNNSSVRAGFIHLPLLPEQLSPHAKNGAHLPRETAVKGVRIAIETCLRG